MAGLGLAWVVSTVGGVIAGASSLTGKPETRPWLNRLTVLVPYIFVAGSARGACVRAVHRPRARGDRVRYGPETIDAAGMR